MKSMLTMKNIGTVAITVLGSKAGKALAGGRGGVIGIGAELAGGALGLYASTRIFK